MIKCISLKNVKCFENQSIALTNLNILSGLNGAGKSTIIQSILMVAQSKLSDDLNLNGDLIELGNYNDLRYQNANDDSLQISIQTENGKITWGYTDGFEAENIGKTLTVPMLEGDIEPKDCISKGLIYLCAERWGPRANVPLNTQISGTHWLGKHGEYTIELLAGLMKGTVRDKLGNSISNLVVEDPRRHDEETSDLIFWQIVAWMGEISPGVKINARVVEEASIGFSEFTFGESKPYKANNVGFGLSYALSVVTALIAAQSGSLIILENPEAHLHPQGQSKLGSLIALTAKAGVQVIVETHSDHLINGARIMARKNLISPDEFNIMFVERSNKTLLSDIKFLKVNEVGQIDEWPDGFFDQQLKDMQTLISGD